MHTKTLLTLAVVAASLAAGCLQQPADEVDAASAPTPTEDLTLAAPITETFDGDVLVSASTPARTVNYGGEFSIPYTLTETATGVVVEVEWSAASSLSEQLSIWFRDAGVGNVPPSDPMELVAAPIPDQRASGASPLRIAIPAASVEPGDYEILVRAADDPVGASVAQTFTMHVTTFDGLPFDEAYSALGAASDA